MTDHEQVFLEQLKLASELHRHMDSVASQRFNYFIAVNAVLVPALTLIWFSDTARETATLDWSLAFTAVIAAFGVVTSLVWSMIHKRTQMYHTLRCKQAEAAEAALLGSESTDASRVRVYKKRSEVKDEAAGEVRGARFGTKPDYDLMWTIPVSLCVVWSLGLLVVLIAIGWRVWHGLPSSTFAALVVAIASFVWPASVVIWIWCLPKAWGNRGKETEEHPGDPQK